MRNLLSPRNTALALLSMTVAAAATLALMELLSPPMELPNPERANGGGAIKLPLGPQIKDTMSPYKLNSEG